MAPQHRPLSHLRIVTQRIAATPVQDLPLITPQLVDLITSAKDDLSRHGESQDNRAIPDFDVLLHKLKTQLSTLLQDKSSAGRWTGIILIKTFVAFGGQSALEACGPWARAMISFLGQKFEHSAVKKAAILTLVKIFLVTKDFPALKREITTPSLQPFITHCLNSTCVRKHEEYVARPNSPLLGTVLQAFVTLLPRHPTSFRVFRREIRSMISPLLAPTPSQINVKLLKAGQSSFFPRDIPALSQRLLALIPYCAPNNTAPTEWSQSLEATLSHSNRTADLVYRSIREEAGSENRKGNILAVKPSSGDTVGDEIGDVLDLPPWRGINSGVERLVGCVHILEAHLATTSSSALSMTVAPIWNILERILSVYPPSQKHQPEVNPEIGREERETLWLRISAIHEAGVSAVMTLLRRMGQASISLADVVLSRLRVLVEFGQPNGQLRGTVYQAVARILALVGPSMSKPMAESLRAFWHAACTDIEEDISTQHLDGTAASGPNKMGSGSLLGLETLNMTVATSIHRKSSILAMRAVDLLKATLGCLRPECLPHTYRAKIDRAIILTQQKDAMLTSVLNPPKQGKARQSAVSILPFLARAYSADSSVESLLRPRLQTLQRKSDSVLEEFPGEKSEMPMEYGRHQNRDTMLPSDLPPRLHPTDPFRIAESVNNGGTDHNELVGHSSIQSPKRPRAVSPFRSWSAKDEDVPSSKKIRPEQLELPNLAESLADQEPAFAQNGVIERSVAERTAEEYPQVAQARSTAEDDDGSERSITPELIIPSDLGISSDEEEEVEGNEEIEMQT